MPKVDLLSQYKENKSDELRQRIVISYLWLVKHLAGRLSIRLPACMSQEDLESCGIFGLLEAIEKFDPGIGRDFESYAYVRVRGAMLDELRRINWIPRTIWQKTQLLKVTREKLEHKFGKEAPEEAVAHELGCDVTEIRRLDAHSRRFYTVSLDETANPSGTGDSVRLGDLVPDEASPDPLELITEGDNRSLLVKAIESLNVKDRLVLSLYYQEGLTLKEISKILEVTESRVCQVHSKILSKLKDRLKELKWEY